MSVKTLTAWSYVVLAASPAMFAAQLLTNPGFESPGVAPSSTCGGSAPGCLALNAGDTIPGWKVVQGPGSTHTANVVDLLTSAYQEGALRFDPEEGNQALDLTGNFNQGPNGVAQTIATVPGAGYTLSFWEGNQDNAQSNYPLFSQLDLYINGARIGGYTTTVNTASDVAWQNFTFSFNADGSGFTTVTFINTTPIADNYTGLDNVTLNGALATPEPDALALLAGAFAGIAAWRRRSFRGV